MSLSYLLETYGSLYKDALLTTWWMTLVSFALVMVVSTLITSLRVSPFKPLRVAADLYVQIFRNIPGISLLIFVVYALPYLKVILNYRVSVILVTVLIASAFGSEHFMSGINTIKIGEIEAARSIGLNFIQILRHLVIPQALRSAVLPMTNLFVGVMLTTALGSQVPLNPAELTGVVSYINTRDVGGILTFLISALGYVLTSVVISYLGNRLDKKVRILR